MFGIRTPNKNTKTERAGPSAVRRSVGEIEARMTSPPVTQNNLGETQENRSSFLQTNTLERKPGSKAKVTTDALDTSPKQPPIYKNRMAEAKACLMKAKLQLGNSRNLKSDIKADVLNAIERLYALVRDAEVERTKTVNKGEELEEGKSKEYPLLCTQKQTQDNTKTQEDLVKQLEEHGKLLKQHKAEMSKLKHIMDIKRETYEEACTYASVAARTPNNQSKGQAAMHSVIVTSQDDQETGEQVLEKIKKVVNAREEGVKIDKIRQARDRKVIIGCRDREEIRKVKDKIKETGGCSMWKT